MTAATTTQPDATTAVANLITYLESGVAPEGLFAPDIFGDVTFPQWRVQADTAEKLMAIRSQGHPCPGQVRVVRVEPTERGFTMEFEERWGDAGQHWYAREILRADVVGATIVDISIYCTGDWDEARQREHAVAVALIRP